MSSSHTTPLIPLAEMSSNSNIITPDIQPQYGITVPVSPITTRSRSRSPTRSKQIPTSPSRWKTTEFYVYYIVIAFALYQMFKAARTISSESHPNYELFGKYLRDGWMSGKKIDNSDAQFRGFRDNAPPLILGMIGYLIIAHVAKFIRERVLAKNSRGGGYASVTTQSMDDKDGNGGSTRLVSPSTSTTTSPVPPKMYTSLALSFIFVSALFGFDFIKIVFFTLINYGIAVTCKGTIWNPILTWTMNIGLLFLNDRYEGYKMEDFMSLLAFMDTWHGAIGRWHIFWRMTTLRLISYNMDFYYKHKQDKETYRATHAEKCPDCLALMSQYGPMSGHRCEKSRVEEPATDAEFNIVNYFGYAFYVPLFLAGPIITFNNFVAQMRTKVPDITLKSTFYYFIRLVACILLMEWMMHNIYVVIISKVRRTDMWYLYTPLEMAIIGYFNLKYIWLKLLIIWRFFRLWAMADDIDTVENMHRCMSNNYSAMGFWRSWHRSYNRWLIRYVYIPLGGGRVSKIRSLMNVFIVFTFVAIWHDISMTLLYWSWLITIFIIPELIATSLFAKSKKWQSWKYYRVVCGFGAVGNIILMMVANLVGFAVGMDGMKVMIDSIFNVHGIVFGIMTIGVLFAAAQVMFEVREEEKRRATEAVNIRF